MKHYFIPQMKIERTFLREGCAFSVADALDIKKTITTDQDLTQCVWLTKTWNEATPFSFFFCLWNFFLDFFQSLRKTSKLEPSSLHTKDEGVVCATSRIRIFWCSSEPSERATCMRLPSGGSRKWDTWCSLVTWQDIPGYHIIGIKFLTNLVCPVVRSIRHRFMHFLTARNRN